MGRQLLSTPSPFTASDGLIEVPGLRDGCLAAILPEVGPETTRHVVGNRAQATFVLGLRSVEGTSDLVLMTARAVEGGPAIDVRAFADLFGLTPREREISLHLASGLDVRGTAAACGIRLETARTHIRRILSKTGSGSLYQLVSKVWRHSAV
jgi:DNA-binding CsgD family transcriptional regulator